MGYSYEEANSYINDIPRFTSKNEPEKTKAFLNYLGDISREIPTIHVAGTNGKGSVCAFISSVMKEADYKCAMFTSPHLVSIRERFVIDDEMMTREEFENCFNELMEKVEQFRIDSSIQDYHPTYFEYLFFMGILYFQKKKPDIVILETGLGGRLDATNSISMPRVCVITEIGMDHMEYLGNTVEEIAGEKAGIIKDNIPVIYVKKTGSGSVICNACKEHASDYFGVDANSYKIINSTVGGIDFLVSSRYHKNVNLTVECLASYQVENATLAYNAIEELRERYDDFEISDRAVFDGIKNMRWPGRMEKVSDNFFIDGAHNEDGIKAFLTTVSQMAGEKFSLLYSAVSDKQVEEITEMIIESDLFENYYVAVLDSYRAAGLERLTACFEKAGSRAKYYDSVSNALDAMLSEADDTTICFAAGSLYLVGEIKRIYR